MDMKVSGMYIARQLSFSGVTFRIEEIPLAPAFERVYNRAALLVRRAAGASAWTRVYASHQNCAPVTFGICHQRAPDGICRAHLPGLWLEASALMAWAAPPGLE